MVNLHERELGTQIPISIPSAIAIEELLTTHVAESGDLWINARTLVRNLLNCLKGEEKIGLTAMEVAPIILEEMNMISAYIEQANHGARQVVYYATSKQSFTRCFPRALPKGVKTPRQIAEMELTNATVMELIKLREDIQKFDIKIKGNSQSVLLMTHQSIDLLSASEFQNCKLLESHTGKIKTRTYWNSKLSGKESGLMPFNALTLQIFGDNESFSAYPRKMKVLLVELAQSRNWSPITTNTKIEADLDTLSDKHGAQMLKDMLRNRPR